MQEPAQSWQIWCWKLWELCLPSAGHELGMSPGGAQQTGELPSWQGRDKEPCSGIPGAVLGWRLLCHAAEVEIFAMAPTEFLSTPSCVWVFL